MWNCCGSSVAPSSTTYRICRFSIGPDPTMVPHQAGAPGAAHWAARAGEVVSSTKGCELKPHGAGPGCGAAQVSSRIGWLRISCQFPGETCLTYQCVMRALPRLAPWAKPNGAFGSGEYELAIVISLNSIACWPLAPLPVTDPIFVGRR